MQIRHIGLVFFIGFSTFFSSIIYGESTNCIFPGDKLTRNDRIQIAQCLNWTPDPSIPICRGRYPELTVIPVSDTDEVYISAGSVTFNQDSQPSRIEGPLKVQQGNRIVYADGAMVYRNPKTNRIEKIVLTGHVRLMEPDHLMLADKVQMYPETKSGKMENVLYLFNEKYRGALLPSWGRAVFIERLPNQNTLLQKATYTTCAPTDNAWEIKADSIKIYDAEDIGVARDAVLKIRDTPVFYAPYFSFPTSKKRKSGFLWPVPGYSSRSGFDMAIPYYWNIAPNYDATITAHGYSKRGVMMGGLFRYLQPQSNGAFEGNFLPKDRAWRHFLDTNSPQYPEFGNHSTNRWSILAKQMVNLGANAQFDLNYQQVSDDYYLQDFTTNLAFATERQLLRQARVMYTTTNWLFRGMVQGYQTLNPINESFVSDIYRRLPQLVALGNYNDLPAGAKVRILGQYDQFSWPSRFIRMPDGPRFHINPVLSVPIIDKSYGYLTPSIQWVGSWYELHQNSIMKMNNHQSYNLNLSRFYVDGGLFLDRNIQFANESFTQTLEPRLFYLQVPFKNQSFVPAYDTAFMIFTVDQLFRTNRFSGSDRIGDSNQLSYGITTRWISDRSGLERASIAVGQIRYFKNRRVQLCYQMDGNCYDNPLTLGYLSSTADYSPVATRGIYRFNRMLSIIGDYVWDPAIRSTNNAAVNLHYQPGERKVIQLGYTYMVNGDNTHVVGNVPQNNVLNQASIGFALPLTERWSTLGMYGYNLSKRYSMISLAGLQYDSCCWAFRVIGGQSFNSLSPTNRPQYNNNIYVQLLFKGLGSIAVVDPSKVVNTWIPGYRDPFSEHSA